MGPYALQGQMNRIDVFRFLYYLVSCLSRKLTNYSISLHVQSVAEVAEDVCDCYRHEFGTDYSELFKALSHVNYNVRVAAAEALAAVLDENPDTTQVRAIQFLNLW